MNRSRRGFLHQSLGCAGYLAAAATFGPPGLRRSFAARPQRDVILTTDFARVETLGDGIWAIVSTPLKAGGRHFQTLCNGGLVLGRDGLLAIEAYYSEEGARWVNDLAHELTGRTPTHVLVTHFHADHSRGLPGFARLDDGTPARSYATATTAELMRGNEEPVIPAERLSEDGELTLDLGGRSVHVVGRRGHTPSDVSVELDDASVVWCGDLVWNGMFPNYVDAVPSHLTRECEQLLARPQTTYIPGHGDIADRDSLGAYLDLLRAMEALGRESFEAGTPTADAAAAYRLPDSLSDWVMFSPDYIERAVIAWHRELAVRGGSLAGLASGAYG